MHLSFILFFGYVVRIFSSQTEEDEQQDSSELEEANIGDLISTHLNMLDHVEKYFQRIWVNW